MSGSDDEDDHAEEALEEVDDDGNQRGSQNYDSTIIDDEDEDDEEEDAYNYMDANDMNSQLANTNAITEVQDQSFDEVKFPADTVEEVQAIWNAFLTTASSREAAGEAIYASLFDAAPSLQVLFKTPRAVMALRIMSGINSIVNNMSNPSSLKITVETLGFQHLDLEVTVPRVIMFRDAIIDLFEMELGDRLTSKAKIGWRSILNYVGGAYIYVRVNYAERLKIIASSWATANNKIAELVAGQQEGEEEGEEEEEEAQRNPDRKTTNDLGKIPDTITIPGSEDRETEKKSTMKVPTTFDEMFMFNSAVMGFGQNMWMEEILESFDTIVKNVSNSYRLQEECDTLALRISKYKGTVNLAEFKAVMLASLRSMVPKDWNSAHEVAWTWLWSNVERMLKSLMGKPKVQEKALERFLMSMTEDNQNFFRRELYKRFFILAPAGQDFFKQSTTRLYWLADRVVEMTIEMYRDPRKSVEQISTVGLRHVGYGVPTEFFAPYVTGAVEVVRSMTSDETAEDAFRWSLSLIARMLVRTINEGSTAVACAPRGKRALWMLNITVGTQSISPLYWAIESGSLETANEMIIDLLTIRADRDNYYYGCDDLFERHRDVIFRLSSMAEVLLPTLLDGLIWRSRLTKHGQRRVNYYIQHLLMDAEGKFCQALEWLVDKQDPVIVCHPVVVLFSDLLWTRAALRTFLLGRCWFVFTLIVFFTSQAIMQELHDGDITDVERIATFGLRSFIYLGSFCPLLYYHIKMSFKDFKSGSLNRRLGIPVPQYFGDYKSKVSALLVLALAVMLIQEPILWCLQYKDSSASFDLSLADFCFQQVNLYNH
ncbi:unnamed protein product [Polarella glacialis]|uniref:Globin domain-containing protein n=1 Tax=Polarella glacialis TaxID=89957 RepID=A0A813JUT9_POLGL|nr:unnamed protein product [Polarella glacialis]